MIAVLSAVACSSVDKDPNETEGRGGVGGAPSQGGAGGAAGAVADCVYGDRSYTAGASFPSLDSCNSCSCTAGGSVACTEIACAADCVLDATYRFYWEPGSAAVYGVATLTPPNKYQLTEAANLHQGPPTPPSCTPAMPPCHGDAIDVADIMNDLADADVQHALSLNARPLYGQSTNGEVSLGNFQLVRGGGSASSAGLQVGVDCPSPVPATCTPIPAGIAKLAADLLRLNKQQHADPSCAAVPSW